MNNKRNTQTLLLALVFCVSMICAPFVYGMIPENRDVEMGAQLIENKIDFLLSSLEDDPQIKISENFKEKSHIYKWIHYAIKNPDVPIYHAVQKTGKLHESGDPLQANIQLNETIKKLLELVRVHEDLDPDTLDVIDALLALLDASPEAYSREAGIITSAASDPKGTPKESYALESEEDTVSNFRYYGKLYDLNSEAFMYENGILEFSEKEPPNINLWEDEEFPVFLTPFHSDIYWQVRSERIDTSASAYRKYIWKVRPSETGDDPLEITVSAGLFEGTGEPPIVFGYYNEQEVVSAYGGVLQNALAGIFPGEGNADEPGPDVARPLWEGMMDLFSSAGNHPLVYDPQYYTPITNFGDGSNPIILDTMYVFLPDQWVADDPGIDWQGPLYRGTLVSRNLVVDENSVYEAIDAVFNDPDSLDEILEGEIFTPSSYNANHGLQTVGPTTDPLISDFNGYVSPAETLAMLDNDGFLSYLVQYEEHLMNQEIVDRAHNAYELRAMLSVSDARIPAMIRAYDDLMEQASDAKAGRVFKDRKGDWVRVQQYILRPDNYTVQLLSLSLRGSGPHKGISGMDFTTTLAQTTPLDLSYVADLRTLPWSDWLNTQSVIEGEGDFRFERKYVVTSPAYQLESMYVEFTNPVINGSGDTLRESRTFADRAFQGELDINSETLTVNGTDYVNRYPADMSTKQFDGFDVSGFSGYTTADGTIGVSFHEIADDGTGVYASTHQYQDIWDALRVNVADNDPNQTVAHDIGARSLEIAFNNSAGNILNRPIDVVYVPMARMLWKNDLVD